MAILTECNQCRKMFTTSVSNYGGLCRKCDGTEEREAAEERRWQALSVDDKLNELRRLVLGIAERSAWDGRIG